MSAIFAILIFVANIFTATSARELGLGGGLGAFSFNGDAEFTNPANLADTKVVDWNLVSLVLPQGNGASGNSSFSHQEVFDYFMSDRYLDEDDKDFILQRLGDGLRTTIDLSISPLINFGCPNFAISLKGVSSTRTMLPKSLVELALKGNELGREYRFDESDMSLESNSLVMLSMSYGRRFNIMSIPVDLGFGVRLARGIKAVKLLKAHGYLRTDTTALSSEGVIETVQGEGSMSTAFDLGVAVEPLNGLRVGLAVFNLNGKLVWDRNLRLSHVEGDAQDLALILTLYSLDIRDLSDFVSDTSWETEGEPFQSELPKVVRFSFGYDFHKEVRFPLKAGVDLIRVLNETPFSAKKTELIFAMETKPLKFLPVLRAGLGFGDEYGVAFSYGAGISLKFLHLNFAAQHYKGLFWNSRGGRLAFDLGVIF